MYSTSCIDSPCFVCDITSCSRVGFLCGLWKCQIVLFWNDQLRYRLSNNHNPAIKLWLTSSTWYGILELAEEYGWNPMGTIPSNPEDNGMILAGLGLGDAQDWSGNYWSEHQSLVLLEDALNLADSLELATLNYEPQYIPSLYYFTIFGENNGSNGTQPSLGAIQGVIDLCSLGMFKIEKT